MITKIIIVALIAIIAFPVAPLTQPPDAGELSWSTASVEAKRQRKRKTCKPKSTGRQTITRLFLNSDQITIPGAPGTTKGTAAPYPSTIEVSGFPNGTVTDIDLLLLDLSHKVPEDIDLLLSAPDDRRALVMSDTGRIFPVTNLDLTLDDDASTSLPQTELEQGTYQPTDYSSPGDVPDAFDAPAPTLEGSETLRAFNGANPNGTWRLWTMDDASGDTGSIAGWALRITVEVDIAKAKAKRAGAKQMVNVAKKRKKCKR